MFILRFGYNPMMHYLWSSLCPSSFGECSQSGSVEPLNNVLLFICFAFSFVAGSHVAQAGSAPDLSPSTSQEHVLPCWDPLLVLQHSLLAPGSFTLPPALAPELQVSPRIPSSLCWKTIRDQVLNTRVLLATGGLPVFRSP